MAHLLSTVVEVFEDFEYTDQLAGDGTHALIFRARVGDKQVEGLDHLTVDADGLITQLIVMVRPLSGLIALARGDGRASGRGPGAVVKQLADGVFQLKGRLPMPNAINTYLVGDVLIDAGARFDAKPIPRAARGPRRSAPTPSPTPTPTTRARARRSASASACRSGSRQRTRRRPSGPS